ncbi:hypothetical protein ACFSC3_12160 [Sphingomonas floccifaciens]|uniref:Glycosyltransferase RgtA/B/C/D-like domain-containing protein n=1 Tax=Sphingomonas floccifaciens TaxID=1844115 RepID=A0ABW4NDU7_9SPHN
MDGRRIDGRGWREWTVAVLLLAVAVAVRARDFGNPVIHVDEQYYLLVGDRMLSGAVPYVDLWDRKPIGLFLIFAAIRMLPGDGVLAYQLVATVCAAATAWLIARGGRRLGASMIGSVAAAVAYIVWLSFLSGRGGQSPVFYNLFVAAGGVLTLGLPARAQASDRSAILWSGCIACLLAGMAIQVKYTPVVEGAMFGAAHLWYLHRAGARWGYLTGAALLWMLLGLAPTLVVIAAYAAAGAATFDAFWFANFMSVTLRRGYPAAKIVARLAGTSAQLSVLAACVVASLRDRPRSAETVLAAAWLAAALVAFAMIGAFFDHYALPLLVPITILAAPALGRHRWARIAVAAGAVILAIFHLSTERDERTTARTAAAILAKHRDAGCPYVFAGDSVLYLLSRTCVPTPYAFPSTLAYEPERGAVGIDEAAEVARIIATRPPAIVTMDEPLAPWNAASHRIVATAIARDYRLAARLPREGRHLLVYVRRDLRD